MFKTFVACLALVVSARAQSSPPVYVTSLPQLVALNPGAVTSVILLSATTNSGALFWYKKDATDATNATDILKPTAFGGRWIKQISNGGGGGGNGNMLGANNLSDVANTNSALANLGGASQQNLTTVSNAVNGKLSASNNLSDVANTNTALQNLGGASQLNVTTISNLTNAKLNTNNGTAYALGLGDATASRAAAIGADGKLTNATTTLTELNRLSGVTSPVQTQIDANTASIATKLDATNGSETGLTVSDGTARRGVLLDANKKFTPDTTVIYAKLYCAADGTTDDTTALGTTAVAAVPTGGILDLGGATYAVTALSIAKSDFKIRNGTIKFSATNGVGVVITGNDWSVDAVNVDGNSKAATGYFVNNGSKRWVIKNSVIKNIYGDDVTGVAVVTGIFIKRGVQSGTISDCVITNVTHATNGTRVSRAVALTDFGYSGTNDQVLDITISRNKFYNIGPGEFGDCVALNMQRSYSSRVIVSDCQGINFGQRFGKVEAAGTIWIGNLAESYSNNEIGSLVFSGFSFYGPTNQCNGNTVIGNFALGIEFGSYSSGFEAYYGQANGNLIIFNTANAATNGIGIDFTQRAYNLQADGNVVLGGKYAARLNGGVQNCQLGLTLATNQFSAGIICQTDGTNAPSDCDLGSLRISSSLASYGLNILAGTNINTGYVHGSVASSLRNRALGVTGNIAADIDSQNWTAQRGAMFGSNLAIRNAPFSVSANDLSFDGAGYFASTVQTPNLQTRGLTLDDAQTERAAYLVTPSSGTVTLSMTNHYWYRTTMSADITTVTINDTASVTNAAIRWDLYADGTHTNAFPSGWVLPATITQPLPAGLTTFFFERTQGTNYVNYTPTLVGTADLVNNAVTDSKLRAAAALSVIGRSANSTGNPADITAANSGEVLRRSGTSLGFGTLDASSVTSGQFAMARLALGTPTGLKFIRDDGTLAQPTATTDFGTSMGVNDTFIGNFRSGLNNSGGVTQWDAVYLNGSSQWVRASSSGGGSVTYPCRGLATVTASTANPTTIVVNGTIRHDSWSWTPGGTIYLGASAGSLTQTIPVAPGDVIQQVGYALNSVTMAVEISTSFTIVTAPHPQVFDTDSNVPEFDTDSNVITASTDI
jgi:hypothetical protein